MRIAAAQLDGYMEGSAAAVGRIMAPLLGAPEPEDVARLGVAFQLTNFIRDVRRTGSWTACTCPACPRTTSGRDRERPFRERVAREVGRARALFAETAGLARGARAADAPRRGLARAVYARVLDRVEGNGYDVLGAARLRPWEAAAAALGR